MLYQYKISEKKTSPLLMRRKFQIRRQKQKQKQKEEKEKEEEKEKDVEGCESLFYRHRLNCRSKFVHYQINFINL